MAGKEWAINQNYNRASTSAGRSSSGDVNSSMKLVHFIKGNLSGLYKRGTPDLVRL